MKSLGDLLTFDAGDGRAAAYALAVHALTVALLAAAVAGARPALVDRGRRWRFLLIVVPGAVVVGTVVQVLAVGYVPELHWRYPAAPHHLLVYFAAPWLFVAAVLAVGFGRYARPAAGAADDYAEGDPISRDVTPPAVRRTVPRDVPDRPADGTQTAPAGGRRT